MAKKVKGAHPAADMPIDRVESFLQNNAKKLLAGVAGLIVVFLVVYGGMNVVKSGQHAKLDQIGDMELSLRADVNVDGIKKFADLAPSMGDAKDYVNMRAAIGYNKLGDTEDAKKSLKLVGSSLAELRDGMLFDLGEQVNADQYLSGKMSALWYYRALLNAQGEKRDQLLKEFAANHPDSALLKLIENWGA